MADKKRNKEDYINLSRSPAQNHYRTEALKNDSGKKKQTALNNIKDFFESKIFSWLYHYLRFRFGRKHEFLNYSNSMDKGIYRLTKDNENSDNEIKIALVSDWATDTKESDRIGALIEQNYPEYSIHLGDTYFVGMKMEMFSNYLSKNSSWFRGTQGSFALLGNHEMYSKGKSYFRDLLPSMGVYVSEQKKFSGQKASYFCLENDYWRIIALDTGYNSVGFPFIEYIFKQSCRLEDALLKWLEEDLKIKSDKRGIVFLSHHQYCSAFEEEFYKPAEQIAAILGKEKKVLWFWGHEHRLSVYGKFKTSKGITAYGRCIGNGGMPVEFKQKLDSSRAAVNCLVLADERKNTEIKDIEIGYNGFVILKVDNEKLSADYFDINNILLCREKWESDIETGVISGKDFEVVNKKLSVYSNIIKAID